MRKRSAGVTLLLRLRARKSPLLENPLLCVVVSWYRYTTQQRPNKSTAHCVLCCAVDLTTTQQHTTHNSGFLAFVLCIWSVCVVALVRHRSYAWLFLLHYWPTVYINLNI